MKSKKLLTVSGILSVILLVTVFGSLKQSSIINFQHQSLPKLMENIQKVTFHMTLMEYGRTLCYRNSFVQ
ncbi:hypothetical protein QGM71_20105 [Virgibacillus sp. C22-A2]|uniref:Uncharacterized protein n=1 Tax=Virgibacillus tibetensis TaxID=3042313 RepID=A0ABU6KKE2_9BACI|nr:hypothetical protein [Virgibacillus sp. C22-A2]